MNTIYHIVNSFKIKRRIKEIDNNTPFNIRYIESTFPSIIQYKDWTNIKIDEKSQELYSVCRISRESIQVQLNDLLTFGLIQYQSAMAIGGDESLNFIEDGDSWFAFKKINVSKSLIIYPNALVLYLPGAGAPKYFIKETEEFGAIADNNFNIIAFVISGITIEEITLLKEYAQRNPAKESIEVPQELQNLKRNFPMMDNKEELMRKILALKNVHYWELVYFGLERALIDNSFIVAFALEYLASEKVSKDDSIMLEIAGLLNNELERATQLLKESIKSPDLVMIEKGRLYNRIWLYLSLAVDMKELNLIE